MYVAIAHTESAPVSTVAGAYDLIDYSMRTSISDDRDSGIFGVAPHPSERFGFMPYRSCEQLPRADWIFVPAVEVDNDWRPDSDQPLIDWLRRNARNGAIITAVGTGSFLLAEAGLLPAEAVTHSNFNTLFAKRYPAIRLRTDIDWMQSSTVVLSGDTPWYELVLAMIARLMGATAAHRAAQMYALEWQGLIDPACNAELQADPVIARARQWLSKHYREHDLVERCAQHVGLSRRSLNRRFKDETGIILLTTFSSGGVETGGTAEFDQEALAEAFGVWLERGKYCGGFTTPAVMGEAIAGCFEYPPGIAPEFIEVKKGVWSEKGLEDPTKG